MGANMGKQPTYTYGFPARRRASNIDSANTFSKDFWASNGVSNSGTESPGKGSGGSGFWTVDSERRYRQEVFDRESENFYPSASTYRTQNNFSSPFSFTDANSTLVKTPKPLTSSSSERSSRMALPNPSPPYTSRSSQQNTVRAGEPKYLPRCGVVGM